MYIRKNYSLKGILALTGGHIIWLSVYALLIASLYRFTAVREFSIPWLPISIIGTAVAFYVGFKNNQAYDRLWEARKIWGGILNSSRIWGSAVRAFVSGHFATSKPGSEELQELKRKLLYRQIAWAYRFRTQLLEPASWEHVSLRAHYGAVGERRRKNFGVGLLPEDLTETHLKKYLSSEELKSLSKYKNGAGHLLDVQSQELAKLREQHLIDDYRHMELQKVLSEFYEHQGKAERIKKFPLPRQYGSVSFIFICLFIFMLPFGMASEFMKLGDWGIWLSVPFCVMVGWIFIVMELVGDYSENPFEGLPNDVPMFSICRTLEIDLLQQLGETEIPDPVQPVKNVLL